MRALLSHAFWLAGRLRFEVRPAGFEHFGNEPATLVVSNHKSDFDVVLLAPLLHRAGERAGPVDRLAFVAAERGEGDLPVDALSQRLRRDARDLAAGGLRVDTRLLDERAYACRWRDFLAYAEAEGLLQRVGERVRLDRGRIRAARERPPRGRAPTWAYSANEFSALLRSRL